MNWRYARSTSDTCDFEVVDGDGDIIAGEYGIREEGHARLIAAAPYLLAALKLAKDHSELEDEVLDIVNDAILEAERAAA